MAKCVVCGNRLGFMEGDPMGRCNGCINEDRLPATDIEKMKADEEAKAQLAIIAEQTARIILTTEVSSNLRVAERRGIITAQAAFEINNFKDLFVGLMNPQLGRANEMEVQLDTLREKVLSSLKQKTMLLGCNGVVGVDLDISTVTIGQISMLMMVGTGTAVRIEE